MDDFRKLLTELGVPPVIAAAAALLVIILLFFLKRALDQRERQVADRRNVLKKYLQDQEQGLLKAYRMLYEGKNLMEVSPKELGEIICQADDSIMDPFTRYRVELPLDVKGKIYNDVHSVLAQFKPDPTSAHPVAPDAIRNLIQYREQFLREIESVKNLVDRHL